MHNLHAHMLLLLQQRCKLCVYVCYLPVQPGAHQRRATGCAGTCHRRRFQCNQGTNSILKILDVTPTHKHLLNGLFCKHDWVVIRHQHCLECVTLQWCRTCRTAAGVGVCYLQSAEVGHKLARQACNCGS